jgi:hypothetical protein
MKGDDPLADEPFSYRDTKSGLVQISYCGKMVTTLSGADAVRFLNKVESAKPEDVQLAMAKATGHFKHGTERLSREKGRLR